ncbi:MAG: hypothetical protein EPO40_19785 [Myxococcaceae bacterium]|nr:MAG: hypothetical protein EPO40_19785 [Myxococcaceae bacterium]
MGEITVMVFWQTRYEVEQVLGAVLLHRFRLTESLGADAEYAFDGVDRILRSLPQWSAPTDLARVPIGDCCDLKVLATAFEEACPGAERIVEELGHIVDAAASGYWTGADEDTETYRRTRRGWKLVRDRRGEVSRG